MAERNPPRRTGEIKMEFVTLTHDNIEQEHICCAIANEKDIQVVSKKNWLKERLDEGLVFLKGNVRGKCFIEYIPAEYAWAPVEAEGYMYIDCLWVSGQFKGHGYSTLLLDKCVEDSKEKGKKGLVILSSQKKKGFLSDPAYMRYKGFETADTAAPYFELLYLPFDRSAEKPRFKNTVQERGGMAKARGAALHVIPIRTREEAQNAPSPFTTFSLFYDGQLVTHEILSEKKFENILISKGM